MNSYRFNSAKDPTDEMLAQIMHEVAQEAKAQDKIDFVIRAKQAVFFMSTSNPAINGENGACPPTRSCLIHPLVSRKSA